jgi:queuine tRNA-ribosyltransferase
MYRDLRRQSAERLVEMDFDGYAIGGLSVGEPRDLTLEMIAEVLPLLPAGKPRYVMGVGYPDEIEQYARMGVDMMDCVLPTRAARHGLLFTSEGKISIKQARYAGDDGRSIRTALAVYAGAIRGRICVIFMRPMRCWRKS